MTARPGPASLRGCHVLKFAGSLWQRIRLVDWLPKGGRLSTMPAAAVAVVLCSVFLLCQCAQAQQKIFISPTDNITQQGRGFNDYFLHPEEWRHAAGQISEFSLPARYLLTASPQIVRNELAVLHRLGIRLDVAILALPVDKQVCGNGIEGTVWPGEPASQARRLKSLGADVYSFSLDLPLNAGYREQGPQACHLSIQESAVRTAHAVASVLAVYPAAKIFDIEVPTGMPPAEWAATLRAWLDAYKAASQRDFDGLLLDAWWLFDWRSAVRATIQVTGPRHMLVGIGIDASGARNVPAKDWITLSKRNACALRRSGLRIDILGVANWQNMNVRGVPETDPTTLTGLVDWIARGMDC